MEGRPLWTHFSPWRPEGYKWAVKVQLPSSDKFYSSGKQSLVVNQSYLQPIMFFSPNYFWCLLLSSMKQNLKWTFCVAPSVFSWAHEDIIFFLLCPPCSDIIFLPLLLSLQVLPSPQSSQHSALRSGSCLNPRVQHPSFILASSPPLIWTLPDHPVAGSNSGAQPCAFSANLTLSLHWHWHCPRPVDVVPKQPVHKGQSVNLLHQKARNEGISLMKFLKEPICFTFSWICSGRISKHSTRLLRLQDPTQ